MPLVRAKLIKLATAAGLVEVEDDIPLGKAYLVDIDSIKREHYYNLEKGREHWKEVIITDSGKWLPVELLEFVNN